MSIGWSSLTDRGLVDRAANDQIVAGRQRGSAIDVGDRRGDAQPGRIVGEGERRRPGRTDRDLRAGTNLAQAQHVYALEQLLVQYRRVSSIDRVLVGLACGLAGLRDGVQHPPCDTGRQRAERRVHGHRKRQGRSDRAWLGVAKDTLGGDDREPAVDRYVDPRRGEGDRPFAAVGTRHGAVAEMSEGIVDRCHDRHVSLHLCHSGDRLDPAGGIANNLVARTL
jgi:hypothetical protein